MADGHYSVVSGLDQGHIYLEDPEIGGERKINREDVMRAWFDFSGEVPSEETFLLRQMIIISQ